jgi:hemoglobin
MPATLYERCGGAAGIGRIVIAFYDKVLESDVLGSYFHSADLPRLLDQQSRLVASLMGAPEGFSDSGRREVFAEFRLDEPAFEEMVGLLGETLGEFALEPTDIEAALAKLRARKHLIVAPKGH